MSGRAYSRSSESSAIACSGTAHTLRRVFVFFSLPWAKPERLVVRLTGRTRSARRPARAARQFVEELRCHDGQRRMEPFWSPAGATAGNQWQWPAHENRSKTVAIGCYRLRPGPHGKEGVGGSSPPESSAKPPQIGAFCFPRTCTISSVRGVWSPFWSPQVRNARPSAQKCGGSRHLPSSCSDLGAGRSRRAGGTRDRTRRRGDGRPRRLRRPRR
jgi:hypothetical protein